MRPELNPQSLLLRSQVWWYVLGGPEARSGGEIGLTLGLPGHRVYTAW